MKHKCALRASKLFGKVKDKVQINGVTKLCFFSSKTFELKVEYFGKYLFQKVTKRENILRKKTYQKC